MIQHLSISACTWWKNSARVDKPPWWRWRESMQRRALQSCSNVELLKNKSGLSPTGLGPGWSFCLECNLPAVCRPLLLCLIFKQTPVKSPCLISHSSWKLAKKLKKIIQLISSTKIEGQRSECGFLFQPSVCVLNIDFYGRLNGLVLLSTKMSRNNRLFKVLCSARCLHNKLLQIPFFSF